MVSARKRVLEMGLPAMFDSLDEAVCGWWQTFDGTIWEDMLEIGCAANCGFQTSNMCILEPEVSASEERKPYSTS